MFGKGAGDNVEIESINLRGRHPPRSSKQTGGLSMRYIKSHWHMAVLGKSIMPIVGLDGLADMLPSGPYQPNHDARVFWRQDKSC